MSTCDCFDWGKAAVVVPGEEALTVYREEGSIFIRQQEWLSADVYVAFPIQYAPAVARAIAAAAKEASDG